MAKNPDIDLTKIKSVGKIETGDLQFKIPETIRNRQVVLLVAYLSWFAEINLGDLKMSEQEVVEMNEEEKDEEEVEEEESEDNEKNGKKQNVNKYELKRAYERPEFREKTIRDISRKRQ